MTIPIERTWAIRNVREFLRALMDPQATKRIPKEIRHQAYRLLKHFPTDLDMRHAQRTAPDIWGKEGEK